MELFSIYGDWPGATDAGSDKGGQNHGLDGGGMGGGRIRHRLSGAVFQPEGIHFLP